MSAVAASSTESTFGSVFVRNLDGSVDNKTLFETFCVYGTMISCNVILDQNGASKCFAFVYFETKESAQKAILEANGTMLAGKKIMVTKCQTREELAQRKNERAELKTMIGQQQEAEGFQAVNLFVKNIDDSVNDEGLKTIFVPFGAITSAKVMRDESGQSKGFGFVCFEKADNANRALNVMNMKMVGSEPLFVSIAQRKEDRLAQFASQMGTVQRGDGGVQGENGAPSPQRVAKVPSVPATYSTHRQETSPFRSSKNQREELETKFEVHEAEDFNAVNLFVKNIDYMMDDEGLRNIFAPFGTIISAKVMMSRGSSRGFGFVYFQNADDAYSALNVMHMKMVGSQPLHVSIAHNKFDRIELLVSRKGMEQRGFGGVVANGGALTQHGIEASPMPPAYSARRRQFSPEPVISLRPQAGLGQFAQDRVEAPEIVYGLIKNLNLDKTVETKVTAFLLGQDNADLARMAHNIYFFDSMVEEAKCVLGLASRNPQQPFMRPIRI